MDPTSWTASVLEIKSQVEAACGCSFNSVLLNLYRDGNDHVSWHSDNEPMFSEGPRFRLSVEGGRFDS